MPEGLKLIVTSDVTQAEQNLKKFVNTAGQQGEKAAASLTTGLNKVNPAAAKTFGNLSTQAKSAIKPISLLGDSIETLRAKLLARKEFLIRSTDIAQIRIYNNEIKLLEAEIIKLQAVGTSSMGAVGKAGTKAFSAIRNIAHILPGLGIAGIFGLAFAGIEKFVSGLNLVSRSFNAAKLDAELFKKAAVVSGDDLTRLNALVSVAKDVSFSTNTRKNAIAELQKLYPDYLRNISLETINSDNAKKAIDDLSQSILNKALVQEFSTRAAAEIIKQDELHEKVLERYQQTVSNTAQLEKLRADKAPANAIKKFSGILEESNNNLVIENREFQAQSEIVKHLTDRLKNLTAASLDFTKTPKTKAVGRVDVDFVAEFVNRNRGLELREQLANEIIKQFEQNKSPIKIPKLVSPVEITSFNINLDPTGTNFSAENQKKISTDIQNLISKNPLIVAIPIDPEIVLNLQRLQAGLNAINAIIQQSAADVLGNVGETLGSVLAGGDIKKGLQGFVGIIGDALQAIGKQMIFLSPVIAALKEAIKTLNPAILLPAGIALVGIGAALKQSISGIKGFAEGGFTGFGSPNDIAGVVHKNEFVLSQAMLRKLKGNNSQPNLSGLLGGQNMQVQVVGRINGNDILLSNARTGRSQKRLSA